MTEKTDVNANFLNSDWWETVTVEDVKAEIAKGADVNARDKEGSTPLMCANESKIRKFLRLYLRQGQMLMQKTMKVRLR